MEQNGFELQIKFQALPMGRFLSFFYLNPLWRNRWAVAHFSQYKARVPLNIWSPCLHSRGVWNYRCEHTKKHRNSLGTEQLRRGKKKKKRPYIFEGLIEDMGGVGGRKEGSDDNYILIKNGGKGQGSSKEEIQMANEYFQKSSTSLVTRECKWKLLWDSIKVWLASRKQMTPHDG